MFKKTKYIYYTQRLNRAYVIRSLVLTHAYLLSGQANFLDMPLNVIEESKYRLNS